MDSAAIPIRVSIMTATSAIVMPRSLEGCCRRRMRGFFIVYPDLVISILPLILVHRHGHRVQRGWQGRVLEKAGDPAKLPPVSVLNADAGAHDSQVAVRILRRATHRGQRRAGHGKIVSAVDGDRDPGRRTAVAVG